MTANGETTILLIGDDDLLDRALGRALAAEGYRVVHSASAGLPRPSLVVIGPCSDGPNGAGRRADLLAGLDGLPLLVLDSSPCLQSRLAGWRGPLAYLAQPFGSNQLVAAVRAQLRRLTEIGPLVSPAVADPLPG